MDFTQTELKADVSTQAIIPETTDSCYWATQKLLKCITLMTINKHLTMFRVVGNVALWLLLLLLLLLSDYLVKKVEE